MRAVPSPVRLMSHAFVLAALGGAVIALVIAAIVVGIALSRSQHSALDAASVAVRDAVQATTAEQTCARLAALQPSLDTWGVAAAGFDRSGAFIAGDRRLRADGLPAGRAAQPLGARQMAMVETRDGYVLLTVDPGVTTRLRLSVVLGIAVTLVIVWAIARLAGGRWAAARGEVADYQREQREERLRAFLAEAAHELRTPLAIAIGYIGILERGGLGDPELAARIVRDVANEHGRLQQLVERILQLARLDAVPGDATATADVTQIAAEAIALVRPLDPDRTLAIETNGRFWAVIAPDDLRDALRNVLENAIRYAPGAAIRTTIANDGRTTTVQVIDAGSGMDSFSAEHAFDRFYRGPGRGDVPGTGLGLAMVRRIAERAGGRAGLVSSAAGTTVTLQLPSASPSG